MAESLNVSGSVNMPFNLEAEQSVLGSILIKPECIEEVIEHVNADSFYLPQHNAIFSSMMVMYSNSKAIDPVIIADALAKDGKYDEAGGRFKKRRRKASLLHGKRSRVGGTVR